MAQFMDLTGQKFSKLTVLKRDPESKNVKWICKCDCGNVTSVTTGHLKAGHTRSCGCYSVEKTVERNMSRADIDNSKYKALYSHYRKNAKRRDIPFDLTIDEVKHIVHQPCHYCGAIESDTFSNMNRGYLIRHNGMDRINSTGGYEATNVVPCCKTCNFAKLTMTQSEFYDWIKRVSKHLKMRGV